MSYLLDTNIVSDLMRNPTGIAAAYLARVGDQTVHTSIVVAAELRYGAARKKSPRLSQRIETVLGALDVLPFASPADEIYGEIRAQLEESGEQIGANDLFIASQALALGFTLVTDNVREFSRVKSLSIENWLR